MVMYIGPTILGMASRNQVFNEDDLPAGLEMAIEKHPYISSLVVDIEHVGPRLTQITRRTGAPFNLYLRAIRDMSIIEDEIRRGE